MNKRLTVAITTFNRRESLLIQLKSLEKQGHFDEYQIIIFNNCSNYNVEDALYSELSSEFMNIITVHNRRFNVGGDCNIALTFLQVETSWMWLLSDDDVTMPGSIETVLQDIEKYKDACWLKYSISGFPMFRDIKVNNLVDLFDSFRSESHEWGEFVFMSNNVYNLNKLANVRGNILYWAMTCYSQVMGPIMAIKLEHQSMILRSFALTNYEAGRISYKLHYAYLNFPHILNSSFEMSKQELNSLRKMFKICPNALLLSLFEVDNKSMRYEFFKQYRLFYIFNCKMSKIYFVFSFYLFHMLNFNCMDLKRLKALFKKIVYGKNNKIF